MGPHPTDPRPSNSHRAPAPVPADVGIVAALPIELGYFIDHLKRVRKYLTPSGTIIEGESAERVVAAIVSGIGQASARRGTETLIAGHRPNLIISAGFAGALAPGLSRNQVVIPNSVIDAEGSRFAVKLPGGLQLEASIARGSIVTVDHLVMTAREQARI